MTGEAETLSGAHLGRTCGPKVGESMTRSMHLQLMTHRHRWQFKLQLKIPEGPCMWYIFEGPCSKVHVCVSEKPKNFQILLVRKRLATPSLGLKAMSGPCFRRVCRKNQQRPQIYPRCEKVGCRGRKPQNTTGLHTDTWATTPDPAGGLESTGGMFLSLKQGLRSSTWKATPCNSGYFVSNPGKYAAFTFCTSACLVETSTS